MYFLLFIILLLIGIPMELENRYSFISYFKLFICSFICFYHLDKVDTSLLDLLIAILSFFDIIQLLYSIIKRIVLHK